MRRDEAEPRPCPPAPGTSGRTSRRSTARVSATIGDEAPRLLLGPGEPDDESGDPAGRQDAIARIRAATASGSPQSAPIRRVVADHDHGHRDRRHDDAHQDLAEEDGRGADRRREHPAERAGPPLGQQADDPELGREEDEQDGHRRAVVGRRRGRPVAGLALRSSRIGLALAIAACGQSASARPGPGASPDEASTVPTATWTASTCLAKPGERPPRRPAADEARVGAADDHVSSLGRAGRGRPRRSPPG